MAPKAKAGAMKAAAMKGAAALSKSGIVNAMIEGTEIKGSVCKQLLDNLAAVATKEVKSAGKFTIPGLCMLKLKNKPATKAGKKEVFGKVNLPAPFTSLVATAARLSNSCLQADPLIS